MICRHWTGFVCWQELTISWLSVCLPSSTLYGNCTRMVEMILDVDSGEVVTCQQRWIPSIMILCLMYFIRALIYKMLLLNDLYRTSWIEHRSLSKAQIHQLSMHSKWALLRDQCSARDRSSIIIDAEDATDIFLRCHIHHHIFDDDMQGTKHAKPSQVSITNLVIWLLTSEAACHQ